MLYKGETAAVLSLHLLLSNKFPDESRILSHITSTPFSYFSHIDPMNTSMQPASLFSSAAICEPFPIVDSEIKDHLKRELKGNALPLSSPAKEEGKGFLSSLTGAPMCRRGFGFCCNPRHPYGIRFRRNRNQKVQALGAKPT